MKKIFCVIIVVLMVLSGCSAPAQIQESGEDYTQEIYELTFDVDQLSGWPFGGWEFVYTYNRETITSGHRISVSPEFFTFHTIQVDVVEKDDPSNSCTGYISVALCHKSSGKTEITVTAADGGTSTFRVTCRVKRVGKM